MNSPYSPPKSNLERTADVRQIPIARSVIAAVTAEFGTYATWIIVLLIAGVVINNPDETKWFAYLFGQSVGIGSGFLLCILAGRWVALRSADALKTGLAVGIICAAFNAVLVSVTTKFPLILLVGTLGRVLGGCVGGWLAHRSRKSNNALLAKSRQEK